MSVPLLKADAVPCSSSVEIGLKEQVQGSSAAVFGIPGRAVSITLDRLLK